MSLVQPQEENSRKERLAALRAQLAARPDAPDCSGGSGHGLWSLGDDTLDAVFPDRACARGRLHDIVFATAGDQAAATGFAAMLAVRLAGKTDVFWCQRQHDRREAGRLYGPGIAALGGDATRFVHVCVRRDIDVLWVMEEAIASGAVDVVVGESARIDLTASRRLSLAAEKSGVTAFILRPATGSMSNAAWTRWLVEPAPSAPNPFDARALGPPRFRLTLQRSRAGMGVAGSARPHLVEWTHETHRFAMVAPLADRTPQAAPAPAGTQRLAVVGKRRAG